ncbi:MAG: GFA family protein [Gammaproteobacteria bacterium]
MTNKTYSGGCQCGAVRYRISGEFGRSGICHCRMCQKAFGSWGAALVTIPATSLAWTRGTPSIFRSSSIVARGFCKDCGTPLYMREDGHPDYDLAIGTLDDPNVSAPIEQVGIESKLAWFDTLAALPAHRTQDERTPEDLKKLTTFQHPDHDTETWPPR